MSLTPNQLLEDESFRSLGRRILTGRVAIFLGAGSSLSSGAPSTEELARLIGREVLQTGEEYPLADIVDYADGGPGRREVSRVIVDTLQPLTPSASLLSLASLPWPRVFSVNFDDLFEKALRAQGQDPIPYYAPTNFDRRTADQIPVYMLHGSIKNANDRNMGLLLTNDDMKRASTKREAFYHQLTDSVQGSEIVYVGFSLTDADFRGVITELHDSVGGDQHLIPRGYAVIPNPPPFAKNHWDTKKITIIDATMEDVVETLLKLKAGTKVSPIPVGSAPILGGFLASVDPGSSQAEEFAWAFDFPDLDTGESDPNAFYRGAPPDWAAIRDGLDAPRDLTDSIAEDLLVDPADEPPPGSGAATNFFLLSGHAGSGKTTVAKRLAWTLAVTWRRSVVWLRQPSRLQFDLVERAQQIAGERLYVFVDGAADAGLLVVDVIQRARRTGLPVTFFVTGRRNEWSAATDRNPLAPDVDYELRRISNTEASSLLDRLQSAGELGVLASLPREEQLARLIDRAGRQLLVGLREATEGRKFDDIIENEVAGLPRESARRAYITVCTLFQFGIPIRAGVLSRTTGVAFEDFGKEILRPAERVIIDQQRGAREQPTYSARHSVIADIVFRRTLRTPAERANQIRNLLRQLDYGYRDDRRAFMRLISSRWLRDVGVEGSEQAQIHALARQLRPGDASVIQQAGLANRFQDPAEASRLLREAQQLAPNDETIRHSQASLMLDQAKTEKDAVRQEKLFGQVEEALRLLISRRRENSAPYVSLASLMLERSRAARASDSKVRFLTEAEKTIAEAFRNCVPTSHLLEKSGEVAEAVGDVGAAEKDFEQASVAAGLAPHVWITYARFLKRHRGAGAAVDALNRGIDLHPVEPSMNYELAGLLQEVEPVNDAAIRRAYGIAIDEPVRGHYPELDFAIYLHRTGRVSEAEEHFANLRAARLPYSLKSQPRRWLTDDAGAKSTFAAEVADVRLRQAYLNVPTVEGPVYIDYRDVEGPPLRLGNTLRVRVYYNAFGLRAVPVHEFDVEA